MRWIAILGALSFASCAAGGPTVDETRAALEKASAFYRSISERGGYLWTYSPDLKSRAGEKKATPTTIWVQPPGTPSVGMALVRAYEVTGDKRYLEAAREAAEALVWGQLESGGWAYYINFDPDDQRRWYRRSQKGKLTPEQLEKRNNVTMFDDDTTQAALSLMIAVLKHADAAEIRASLDYGLEGMLRGQFVNGAWPQRFDGMPWRPQDHPGKRARIPKDWPREWPDESYAHDYTLNDNVTCDCIRTMLEAWKFTGDGRYLASAKRAGEFLIRAQLPEPQPVWAQQYNWMMEPSWARRFEPPSACSSESIGVIHGLIDLYLETGEEKFLGPIPAALDWFRRSQLEPGVWARFYELGTNKPLYFTKDYRLVYTADDLPTHYSFRGTYPFQAAAERYEKVKSLGREEFLRQGDRKSWSAEKREARRRELAPRARKIIDTLDGKGRWIRNGQISSWVFVPNFNLLCDYLELARD